MLVRALQPNARLPKIIAGAASLFLQLSLVAGVVNGAVPRVRPLPGYGGQPPPIWTNIVTPLRFHIGPMPTDIPSDTPFFFWTEQGDLEPGLCALPRYPAAARRARIEGSVNLLLTVDREGRVAKALVTQSSGDAILDAAALSAFSKCRYRQSTSSRSVVAGKWALSYVFTHAYSGFYRTPPQRYMTVVR